MLDRPSRRYLLYVMSEYTKPLPAITDENREFWSGAKHGKLRMQKCGGCGHVRYPISHVCPQCLSCDFAWADLSGRGEVFSYVVFYQVYNKAFEKDIPYNVALVQLEEGPRMTLCVKFARCFERASLNANRW